MADLETPWEPEQVEQLNRYQHTANVHPYTCGKRDAHPWNEGVLVAEPGGWVCPVETCDYAQNWAHDFSADRAWLDGVDRYWQELMGAVEARRAWDRHLDDGGDGADDPENNDG
jgi:hypothetical protein